MKKKISVLLAVGLLAGLLCGTAQAADILESGFYNIGSAEDNDDGVTVTPLDETDTPVPSESTEVDDALQGEETFYPGSVKLTVELTGAYPGSEYVVLLVSGTALPTRESDIYYIDQITAGETGSVSFNVYPMDITVTNLTLFITSNQESFTTRFVSLHYASAYTLGDIDNDGYWTANDASYALQIAVNKSTVKISGVDVPVTEAMKLAANVDGDEYITANDALKILQKSVGRDVF